MKKKTNPVDPIIHLFGGIRPMSRALKHKNHGRVAGWKRRKRIHPRNWGAIQDTALALGFAVSSESLSKAYQFNT